MTQQQYDKYAEYVVDFDVKTEHTEDEVDQNDASLNDWHLRHKDDSLEEFCKLHPSSPQCRVFDE